MTALNFRIPDHIVQASSSLNIYVDDNGETHYNGWAVFPQVDVLEAYGNAEV